MEVVAEGVELPEQVEFLRHNGCHIIQGFICSRPREPGAVEALLKRGTCPAVG
jgi:EAL domain-containing protein (putative c-di-GMP-specific phosphodiesterase class I)